MIEFHRQASFLPAMENSLAGLPRAFFHSVNDGDLNGSMQHFTLKEKVKCMRKKQKRQRRSLTVTELVEVGIGGSRVSLPKRSDVAWERTVICVAFAPRGYPSPLPMPLTPGADFGRAGGDFQRHCGEAIDPIDCRVVGSFPVDPQPGGGSQWRLCQLSGVGGRSAGLGSGSPPEIMSTGPLSAVASACGREAARGLVARADRRLDEAHVSRG